MNQSFSRHIVIVSAVYPPEPVVSASLAWDLAHFLVDQGNKVTVLCPQPSRPLNNRFGQYKAPGSPIETNESGIMVVRLPSFVSPQSKLFSRLFESYSFGRYVCKYLKKHKISPDVIYVNSWPLLGQTLIVNYAKKNSIPIVLQIMDVYPESLLNKIPKFLSKLIAFPLLKLDQWIARQASSISVISENMRRTYIVSRKIQPDKVVTTNLWQDEILFEPLPNRHDACSHYDVPEHMFTFLYLGNIGPVAGVDFLIKAFHKANLETAQLLIVGGGSSRDECRDLANRLSTKNVWFISDPEVANVALLQSMAHVCLLPLKIGAGLSSIPSKLPAYMLSAKPILATVDIDSDTANAIHDAQCGWVGEPEDEGWLIAKMTELSSFTDGQLAEYGQHGKEYGLVHFSKKIGVEKLSKIVLNAASNRSMKDPHELADSIITAMDSKDISRVVEVHLQSFPEFFLSTLGPRFLSLYYRGVVDAPEGIAFVSLNETGSPAGFVAGTSNPRGFYKRLLKRDWLKFSFASVSTLLRNPRAVRRVARGLLHPGKNPVGDDVAGLFSIGVLPELQGTGAGKKLVHAFLEEARKRGCSKVFLTTDRDDNESVNQFYEKLGFAVGREFTTQEGRNMNEYWITL